MDSAYAYIDKSVRLSRELGDSANVYYHLELLARAYLVDSLPLKAKDVAVTIIKNGGKDITDSNVYFDAANAYVQLNMLDSASYYYENRPRNDHSPSQTVVELIFKTSFYLAQGKYAEAYEANRRCTVLADSIADSNNKMQLFELEKRYDKELVELENAELERSRTLWIVCLSFAGFLMSIFFVWKYAKNRSQLREAYMLRDKIQREKNDAIHAITHHQQASEELKQSLEKQMAVMKELINTSYLFGNDSTKFADKFRKTVKASSTNNRFWENIEHYANGCYNNALNRIKGKFPDLREHEMKFVCLLLCGFSTVEIMVCMGFTNEHSIGNKRLAVAKKMGIDIPLEEYLETYKSEIPS